MWLAPLNHMTRVLAAAAALLLLALHSRPAEACSPPGPAQSRAAFPMADATDVPTNVRILVTFDSVADLTGYEVRVRPVGGEAVELAQRIAERRWSERGVYATPSQPLAPGTTYEVLDNSALPCANAFEPCVGESFTVFSTFTTGSGPDTTPPEFQPSFTLDSSHRACESSACCGPYDIMSWHLAWTPATDDHAVSYEVVSAASGNILLEALGTGVTGALPCVPTDPPFLPQGDLSGAGSLVIRAVDIAGNTTAAPAYFVDVTCEDALAPDAGAPDAGAFDPGELMPSDVETCACRVGGRDSRPAPAVIGFALLGLALLARRRRRG